MQRAGQSISPRANGLDCSTKFGMMAGKRLQRGGNSRLPVFLRRGFGLPLNLGSELPLGSVPQRGAGRYGNLHFLLAGSCGKQSFHDSLGNSFTIVWDAGQVRVMGEAVSPVTWQVLPEGLC